MGHISFGKEVPDVLGLGKKRAIGSNAVKVAVQSVGADAPTNPWSLNELAPCKITNCRETKEWHAGADKSVGSVGVETRDGSGPF